VSEQGRNDLSSLRTRNRSKQSLQIEVFEEHDGYWKEKMNDNSNFTGGGDGFNLRAKRNIANREFWHKESEKLQRAMADPQIARAVMRRHLDELNRRVPVRWLTSMECLCAEFTDFEKLCRQQQARAAGHARGAGDELSQLIGSVVRDRSDITVVQLLAILDGPRGEDLDIRIETGTEALAGKRLIHYTLEDGRQRSISLSALAHRLRRAKKRLAN
jgi:hypothetical protein